MDFDEYWGDVRRGLRPEATPDSTEVVSLAVLHAWAQDTGNPRRPPFVVVSGTNRDILYRQVQSDDWMFEKPGGILDLRGSTTSWIYGLTRHLVERVRGLTIPPEFRDLVTSSQVPQQELSTTEWEILWALVSCPFLVVEEPLDQLIDQRFSLLSDVHRGLLEARFEVSEAGGPAFCGTEALGAWIEGQKHSSLTASAQAFLARANITQTVTEPERAEVLHFLLTLAKQNGLLGGVVLAIDGLENLTSKEVADELLQFLEVCGRWVTYGSPLGLIVGWRGTKEDAKQLRGLHPKLARRIAEADHWIRSLSDVR